MNESCPTYEWVMLLWIQQLVAVHVSEYGVLSHVTVDIDSCPMLLVMSHGTLNTATSCCACVWIWSLVACYSEYAMLLWHMHSCAFVTLNTESCLMLLWISHVTLNTHSMCLHVCIQSDMTEYTPCVRHDSLTWLIESCHTPCVYSEWHDRIHSTCETRGKTWEKSFLMTWEKSFLITSHVTLNTHMESFLMSCLMSHVTLNMESCLMLLWI